MTQSSDIIPTRLWDALVTLKIPQTPDGNYTCSGVKNGTTEACGWRLRGELAVNISNRLEEMSKAPPATAIHTLGSLADITLCHNHKRQQAIKVQSWTTAINSLPKHSAHTQPLSVGSGYNGNGSGSGNGVYAAYGGGSRGLRPSTLPELVRSSYSSSSQVSVESSGSGSARTPASQGTLGASQPARSQVEDEVRLLKAEVARLTERLASLESDYRVRSRESTVEPSTPPRKFGYQRQAIRNVS